LSEGALPLTYFSRVSSGTRDQSCRIPILAPIQSVYRALSARRSSYIGVVVGKKKIIYLVKVDGRLPVVVALKVEMSHTNLTEVTRMVLVEVSTVVVLSKLLAISFTSQFRSRIFIPDHRPYHDHRGAFGACRHDHDRRRRDRGASASW
jgi:hypothetical protein